MVLPLDQGKQGLHLRSPHALEYISKNMSENSYSG